MGDNLRDVRAHAGQHAQLANLLAPFRERFHLAGLPGGVHYFSLPLECQRPQGLPQQRRHRISGSYA